MEPSSTGQKTFFWYRVYAGLMALLYLFVCAVGAFLLFVPIESGDFSRGETIMIAGINIALGSTFLIVFAVAFFLPPKPYNWIVGIVMIAIGLTSCCTWPATVPLLIYWFKPETKAFFGRN